VKSEVKRSDEREYRQNPNSSETGTRQKIMERQKKEEMAELQNWRHPLTMIINPITPGTIKVNTFSSCGCNFNFLRIKVFIRKDLLGDLLHDGWRDVVLVIFN
jgi:hypothetical protein